MPVQQKKLPLQAPPTTHKTTPAELKNRVFRRVLFWKISQKVQKYFYPYVTRRLGADDVFFFNYGYEQDPPMAVPLAASDKPTGTPASSTIASPPRWNSRESGCWRSVAATAAEPHTSCAPCSRPLIRGWT